MTGLLVSMNGTSFAISKSWFEFAYSLYDLLYS